LGLISVAVNVHQHAQGFSGDPANPNKFIFRQQNCSSTNSGKVWMVEGNDGHHHLAVQFDCHASRLDAQRHRI